MGSKVWGRWVMWGKEDVNQEYKGGVRMDVNGEVKLL